MQKILSKEQISAFYHKDFVDDQVVDFIFLLRLFVKKSGCKVIDIGGGYGFFARELKNHLDLQVKVIDSDTESIKYCESEGIECEQGDALNPEIVGDEDIVCFNLILHHLIGESAQKTHAMQGHALSAWHSTARILFINEYIYESFVIRDLSGWLIYQITSNSLLSNIGNLVAKIIPSLKANTFGIGVRFRSHAEWSRIFESLGFEVVDTKKGKEEYVSLARRLLLIKSCRRDSFILKPVSL